MSDIKGGFLVSGEDDEIIIERNYAIEVDEDQKKLFVEISSLAGKLSILFQKDNDKKLRYIDRLRKIAQVAISGEKVDPESGRLALTQLKEEILLGEGWRIKLSYLMKLMQVGSVFFVLGLIIYGVLNIYAPGTTNISPTLKFYAVLFAGSQLGVFLSFGATRTTTTIDELIEIGASLSEPFLRLTYTGLLAIALGLLVSNDVLFLKFGSFDVKSFATSFQAAIFVGLIMGFAEKTLSLRLSAQISNLTEDRNHKS